MKDGRGYGMKPKVLVADDDRDIVRLISDSLQEEGMETVPAYSGTEVLRKAVEPGISLLILDIMMPGMNGLEVCRKLRDQLGIPILFLSAKDRDLDKVVGLEVGADDYMTKPFSIDVLTAKVKAHLRREERSKEKGSGSPSYRYGELEIHPGTFEVFLGGERVECSTKEFQILSYLAAHPDQVLSREQIYDAVWGFGEFGELNTVTVHIKNLRAKLDPDNRYIVTVWGVGYKFTGGRQN